MVYHVDLLVEHQFNLEQDLLFKILPFLASLTIISVTALGVRVTHFGAFLLYGKADELIPLPFPFIYILPILILKDFTINL